MNNHSDLFPIRELSTRTQVNTVTIRAWERRYGLLNPQRSAKGHRLYSEADITTVDTILTYIARGVAISKVKPLLKTNVIDGTGNIGINGDKHITNPQQQEEQRNSHWQQLITQTIDCISHFEPNQLGNHWHKLLTQYPLDLCRDQIIEPLFKQLQQPPSRQSHDAALAFAQSELLRYAIVRMSARSKRKKNTPTIMLCVGNNTPIWPLALMGLRVFDAGAKVVLIPTPCSLKTIAGFSTSLNQQQDQQSHNHRLVYYQDGVFQKHQASLVDDLMSRDSRLYWLGTAPALLRATLSTKTQGKADKQLFTSTKVATDSLLSMLQSLDTSHQ